jgi:hypothetical protein
VETNAKRLGRIERAGHRFTQSREQALRAGSFLEVVPTHERMFAHVPDATLAIPRALPYSPTRAARESVAATTPRAGPSASGGSQ